MSYYPYDRAVADLPYYELATAGAPPVSLADMKAALKITCAADDDFLQDLILASTQDVEKYMNGRQVRANQFYQLVDCFPCRFVLDRVPVDTIDAVERLVDDVWTPVDPAEYYLKPAQQWAEIVLRSGEMWPTDADDVEHSVRVTFTCKPLDCLDLVQAGIRRHVTFLYENRGDAFDESETDTFVASGAQALIQRAGIKNV